MRAPLQSAIQVMSRLDARQNRHTLRQRAPPAKCLNRWLFSYAARFFIIAGPLAHTSLPAMAIDDYDFP